MQLNNNFIKIIIKLRKIKQEIYTYLNIEEFIITNYNKLNTKGYTDLLRGKIFIYFIFILKFILLLNYLY